jgi:rubredoxin
MSVSGQILDKTEITRWFCEPCGFIYDPEEGDPDSGIAPGTPFEDIPDDWMCPICGATKADFRELEPGEFPEEWGR